ncbi:ATP-binding cassette [Lithospermum erythrorhizon]|uniref:ATP-binding cassette n=1 Tax=Lithospermum erythrorhizon TaxID=34254 RepID=A0AAV3RMG6_LITER
MATYRFQGLLENEYVGTSFAVGQVRTISGYDALRNVYEVSPDINSKWKNVLVLFLMAVGLRIFVYILLQFRVAKNSSIRKLFRCNQSTNNSR